jgi:flagellar basal-body rod modification protein FlgD
MSTVNTSATSINDLMATMNTKPAASGASSVDDQANKFMTLLVTQMKNQDPLNPLDNAQVTSQLAQLSTVEGVNKMNATLATLMQSYQSSQALQAASLVGHGVLVEGNSVSLKSGVAVMGVELDSAADNVQVVISDKSGQTVQTIDLGANEAGTIPLAWDGVPDPNNKDADGKPVVLADGNYNFKVVATRAGQALTDVRGLSYDSVISVSTNAANGVKVNLPGKGTVALADIKQVL